MVGGRGVGCVVSVETGGGMSKEERAGKAQLTEMYARIHLCLNLRAPGRIFPFWQESSEVFGEGHCPHKAHIQPRAKNRAAVKSVCSLCWRL